MTDNIIIWADPPPSKTGRPSEHQPFVDALRANPGKWARIPRLYIGRSSTTSLKKRYPDIEWTMRPAEGEEGFWVYGRALEQP